MTIRQLKPKKCKAPSCGKEFMPFRPLQKVCSPQCAAEIVRIARMKQERKELREAKQKVKSRSQWLKEAQVEFNRYIRLRDEDKPCISCGRFHSGQYHAGHYRSVGSTPELRFHEANVFKQCAPCNNFLSGNIVEFRRNLIGLLGAEMVDWLEGPHEPLHLTIPEIQAIKTKYKALCNELLKKRKDAA